MIITACMLCEGEVRRERLGEGNFLGSVVRCLRLGHRVLVGQAAWDWPLVSACLHVHVPEWCVCGDRMHPFFDWTSHPFRARMPVSPTLPEAPAAGASAHTCKCIAVDYGGERLSHRTNGAHTGQCWRRQNAHAHWALAG